MPVDSSIFIDLTQNLIATNLGYLGLSVTIILFAGGLFYVFNFKPLQESIKKQENELDSIKKDVNNKVNTIQGDFGNLVLTQTNALRALIDRTTKEIEILKKDINQQSANSEKKNLELIDKINQEQKILRKQAQSIELNSLWTEHYMWDGMEIHDNTFSLLIDYMEKALEYKELFLTNLWFDRLEKTLTKMKKRSSGRDRKEKERLYAVLEKIVGKEEEKNNIKAQMDKIFS